MSRKAENNSTYWSKSQDSLHGVWKVIHRASIMAQRLTPGHMHIGGSGTGGWKLPASSSKQQLNYGGNVTPLALIFQTFKEIALNHHLFKELELNHQGRVVSLVVPRRGWDSWSHGNYSSKYLQVQRYSEKSFFKLSLLNIWPNLCTSGLLFQRKFGQAWSLRTA